MDWRDLAACRGMATADFYSRQERAQARAIAVCRSCPVALECLEDALAFEAGTKRDTYGIRGGMIAADRIALVRARKAQRSPEG